jgi:hypothetical protein
MLAPARFSAAIRLTTVLCEAGTAAPTLVEASSTAAEVANGLRKLFLTMICTPPVQAEYARIFLKESTSPGRLAFTAGRSILDHHLRYL